MTATIGNLYVIKDLIANSAVDVRKPLLQVRPNVSACEAESAINVKIVKDCRGGGDITLQ
jgi:hypothetical protein